MKSTFIFCIKNIKIVKICMIRIESRLSLNESIFVPTMTKVASPHLECRNVLIFNDKIFYEKVLQKRFEVKVARLINFRKASLVSFLRKLNTYIIIETSFSLKLSLKHKEKLKFLK